MSDWNACAGVETRQPNRIPLKRVPGCGGGGGDDEPRATVYTFAVMTIVVPWRIQYRLPITRVPIRTCSTCWSRSASSSSTPLFQVAVTLPVVLVYHATSSSSSASTRSSSSTAGASLNFLFRPPTVPAFNISFSFALALALIRPLLQTSYR